MGCIQHLDITGGLGSYDGSIRAGVSSLAFSCDPVTGSTDYRTGATLDWAQDAANRDKRNRISCPTLLLWGTDYLGRMKTSPAHELPCGHLLAEQAPIGWTQLMHDFFADAA